MAIFDILNEKLDGRKDGQDCVFNGYLEDYIDIEDNDIDPLLRDAFTKILENHSETKIITGLRTAVSRDAISNQIIRYKDVFKLTGRPLVYPYILYLQAGSGDHAFLLVPYSDYSYIIAKGMYYCMTEPGSEFIDCKNEIVVYSSNDADSIVKVFDDMLKTRAGALQRRLDTSCFENYDVLKEKAIKAAREIKDEACAALVQTSDRTKLIYDYIIQWFLLKKVLYVQHMVNKTLLNTVYEGNVRRQRNQAKLNADAIEFMSYSEMWRLNGTENEKESEEEEAA